MPKCPWISSHDATPDPASLALEVGDVRRCTRCSLFYWVKSVSPYVLKRNPAASAAIVSALAVHGTKSVREQMAPLLKRKDVKAALAATQTKIDEP